MGYRVIAAGYSKEIWEEETSLPESILPLFWIVLEDTVRKNVKETLNYFQQEGIEIKIISGDHVKTVSMTAKKAGLARWKEAVDLSELGEEIDYEAICQRFLRQSWRSSIVRKTESKRTISM